MSEDIVYLTEKGLKDLREELSFLRSKERPRIIQAIADARAHGDLSENAEYDAAKEAQRHLERKIGQLTITMMNARLVDESIIDSSRAYILSQVRVMNLKVKKEFTYTLVSAHEADFTKKKISVDSPIGKGLLGKSKGDVVEVSVPAGTLKLEVLEISR